VGDRSRVALRITNRGTGVVDAPVHCSFSEPLRIGQVRASDGLADFATAAGEFSGALRLPAGAERWVYADVTGASAGEARLEARVELDGRTWRELATCTVEPRPDEPISRPAIRVKRALYLRVPAEGESPHARQRWKWAPQAPDVPVAPGEIVRVHEEVEVLDGGGEVRWVQRLPSNCASPVAREARLVEIGTARESGPGTLAYHVAQLAPGRHVHEYVLAATRTGVALLPKPTVGGPQGDLAVVVEPAELRLEVRE
jgi:hypothetical protein